MLLLLLWFHRLWEITLTNFNKNSIRTLKWNKNRLKLKLRELKRENRNKIKSLNCMRCLLIRCWIILGRLVGLQLLNLPLKRKKWSRLHQPFLLSQKRKRRIKRSSRTSNPQFQTQSPHPPQLTPLNPPLPPCPQ